MVWSANVNSIELHSCCTTILQSAARFTNVRPWDVILREPWQIRPWISHLRLRIYNSRYLCQPQIRAFQSITMSGHILTLSAKFYWKFNSYWYQLCWCKTKQYLSLVTSGPLKCGGPAASPICSVINQTLQMSTQVYNHPASCSWPWLRRIRSPCMQKWPDGQ